MFKSLQSLRFFFALMIFCHHFVLNDGRFLFDAGGDCGVAFFMILGGFVMAHGVGPQVCRPDFSYKTYLTRRLARIYPLHLSCLLFSIVWNHSNFSLVSLVKLLPDFLLLQSWFPEKDIFFGGNALSWYLSVLLFFYAVFPFMWRFLVPLHAGRVFRLVIGCLLVYLSLLLLLPSSLWLPILYVSPLVRILDFLWGMLLYRAYESLRCRFRCHSFFLNSILEFSVLFILIMSLCLYDKVPACIALACYFWPIMLLLVLLFALLEESGGCVSWLLHRPIFQKLSAVSFSFYMIHLLLLRVLDYVCFRMDVALSDSLRIVLFFCITLSVSYAVHYWYELPISSWLKRHS